MKSEVNYVNMKELIRLIKTTGIYFLGTVGTKLISFLLLPLYTAYLLPSQYGRYDVNITYASLFSSVCFLDIWTGIMKYMFEDKEEERLRYYDIFHLRCALYAADGRVWISEKYRIPAGGYGLWFLFVPAEFIWVFGQGLWKKYIVYNYRAGFHHLQRSA